MLVLSRKTNEVICIGPNIYVTVLAIEGGRVRLGVDAPRDVPILRAELQEWSPSDKRGISPPLTDVRPSRDSSGLTV
jgi:carbon storage regulator